VRDLRPQVVLAFRTQHGVLGGLEHHRPHLDFTLANAWSHSYSAGPSHRAGDRQAVPDAGHLTRRPAAARAPQDPRVPTSLPAPTQLSVDARGHTESEVHQSRPPEATPCSSLRRAGASLLSSVIATLLSCSRWHSRRIGTTWESPARPWRSSRNRMPRRRHPIRLERSDDYKAWKALVKRAGVRVRPSGTYSIVAALMPGRERPPAPTEARLPTRPTGRATSWRTRGPQGRADDRPATP
jgi:hypothetical protein